jgi:hypothetical protein
MGLDPGLAPPAKGKRMPKRKIPLPAGFWQWDSRIARIKIRFLELQPPGARRHTCTAVTTETSLRGLLGNEIHIQLTVGDENPDVK